MYKNQLTFGQIEKLMGTKDSRFGGSLLKKSHAKTQRPININCSMHTVLRSSQCKGKTSLTDQKHMRTVQEIIQKQAHKHAIKVYKVAIAYNHVHLSTKAKSRAGFQSFLRSICGLIPRQVLAAERANAKGIKFWDQRPWTRIVSWGKEFRGILKYLEKNTLEAIGFIPYRPRAAQYSSA